MFGRFAWFFFRIGIAIAVATSLASFSLVYPYYMEAKTQANLMLMQVAHDGYFNSKTQEEILAQIRNKVGILGKATLDPNDPADRNDLLPSFMTANELSVKVLYQGTDKQYHELTPQTDEAARLVIENGLSTGVIPPTNLIANRDTPVMVVISTNFKVETLAFGKRLIAHFPVTAVSPGITIKQYRW